LWGKPTGEIKPIPAGKYFRRGGTLLVADGEEGEELTPSSKNGFKLAEAETPQIKGAQAVIQYDVIVEYSPSNGKPFRTIVTVVDKKQRQNGDRTAYRQCVLSGKYTEEMARRVWEREPQRFGPVSAKSVGGTPTERTKNDAQPRPGKPANQPTRVG